MTFRQAAAAQQAPTTREEATFVAKGPANDNRRIFPRYSVELHVTCESDHNFYGGFAENLSAGGVFIATHTLSPVGEKMDFSITLPGAVEPIRGIGEVRWVRVYSERSDSPPGLGLRFVRLAAGAAMMIERFLTDREPLFYDDE